MANIARNSAPGTDIAAASAGITESRADIVASNSECFMMFYKCFKCFTSGLKCFMCFTIFTSVSCLTMFSNPCNAYTIVNCHRNRQTLLNIAKHSWCFADVTPSADITTLALILPHPAPISPHRVLISWHRVLISWHWTASNSVSQCLKSASWCFTSVSGCFTMFSE